MRQVDRAYVRALEWVQSALWGLVLGLGVLLLAHNLLPVLL